LGEGVFEVKATNGGEFKRTSRFDDWLLMFSRAKSSDSYI
jgi:hypothetical protein